MEIVKRSVNKDFIFFFVKLTTFFAAACEAILNGDRDLSAAILEASVITMKNGNLETCLDEHGKVYKIPFFCYTHPNTKKEKVHYQINKLFPIISKL